QVEDDRLLVPVDAFEVGGAVVRPRRTPGTGVVAALRVLDLDDACAQVSEQHRGIRAREHAAEVRDEQSVQGERHVISVAEPNDDVNYFSRTPAIPVRYRSSITPGRAAVAGR